MRLDDPSLLWLPSALSWRPARSHLWVSRLAPGDERSRPGGLQLLDVGGLGDETERAMPNHHQAFPSGTTKEPLSHVLEELADVRSQNDRLSKRMEALEDSAPAGRDNVTVPPTRRQPPIWPFTRQGIRLRL